MCLPLNPFKIEREWVHMGLNCAATINREGYNRCGYVRVPLGHPLHGQHYDRADVSVHGGLTFSALESCTHDDGVGWWFGFDCAHYGDAFTDPDGPEADLLSKHGLTMHLDGVYRSLEYVVIECESLAEQLWAFGVVPAIASPGEAEG